jgi:hypothetical protein
MLSRIAKLALSIALLAAASLASGADYKAGEAEVVKKLPGRDFESVKNSNMPLIVYFYDADIRRNDYAKFMESKVLSSAEFKDKTKPFLFIKIKHDGTDYKGWPAEWLARAKNASALMVASSDMSQVVFYDKNMPKEAITPPNILAQMHSVLTYEEKKKGQGGPAAAKGNDEKEKGPMPPVAENKITVPGLNMDKDKDKKEPSKPPEKKKVAAPTDE